MARVWFSQGRDLGDAVCRLEPGEGLDLEEEEEEFSPRVPVLRGNPRASSRTPPRLEDLARQYEARTGRRAPQLLRQTAVSATPARQAGPPPAEVHDFELRMPEDEETELQGDAEQQTLPRVPSFLHQRERRPQEADFGWRARQAPPPPPSPLADAPTGSIEPFKDAFLEPLPASSSNVRVQLAVLVLLVVASLVVVGGIALVAAVAVAFG